MFGFFLAFFGGVFSFFYVLAIWQPWYLLLWRNYLLEAGWLRHNKNSQWLRQLAPGPGAAHFKVSSRKQCSFWWTRRKS